MTYEECYCDTDNKEPGHIAGHFLQHGGVYELIVGSMSADKSRQKKDDHLYHAPERHDGNGRAAPFGCHAPDKMFAPLFKLVEYPCSRSSLALPDTGTIVASFTAFTVVSRASIP